MISTPARCPADRDELVTAYNDDPKVGFLQRMIVMRVEKRFKATVSAYV